MVACKNKALMFPPDMTPFHGVCIPTGIHSFIKPVLSWREEQFPVITLVVIPHS